MVLTDLLKDLRKGDKNRVKEMVTVKKEARPEIDPRPMMRPVPMPPELERQRQMAMQRAAAMEAVTVTPDERMLRMWEQKHGGF